MRILLTGVTGQVGSALLAPLSTIGTVVPSNGSVFNLAQPSTLPAALDRLAPDMIVNPAAYTAVDRAEDERELAFLVNGEAPAVMAAWAAARGVPLVHFSTDYVFDGSGSRPWREDDRTCPLSVYGASKLAGEEAIRAVGGPHLIVRTSWVYAATGRNFLLTIVRMASELTELRIVADQIGAPTSARLIADMTTQILRSCEGRFADRFATAGGLIHLAASGETSWHGFASAIVGGLRQRGARLSAERVHAINTADFPARARRPANSRLDLTRLNSRFQLSPPPWPEPLAIELDGLALRNKI